jgi:hypothetical protein
MGRPSWFDGAWLFSLCSPAQVAAAGVASIGLMNFSLQTNSVGTYQLAKVRVTPRYAPPFLAIGWRSAC